MQLHVAVPVAPARLWQAVTTSDELAGWFMANDFVAEVGHRCTFWPGDLPGFEEPVSANVLALEPGRLLRMLWRCGQSYAIVTWQIEPTRTGCRLRVTQAGALGSAAKADALAQTYRRLFEQNLPARLRAAAPGAAGRGIRERAPLLAVVAAAVVLLIAIAAAVLPGRGRPGGDDRLGAGPSAPTAGSAQVGSAAPGDLVSAGATFPGITAAPGPPGVTGVPGATRAPAPPPVARLSASVQVDKSGTSPVSVQVTVRNSGDASGTWHSLALRLSGFNLVVEDVLGLDHQVRDRVHTFTPTTGTLGTVPAHGSVTVTVPVLGLLVGVLSCTLDGQPCASTDAPTP